MSSTASDQATRPETHCDESRVPEYTLPDPLIDNAGRPVTSAEQWMSYRRAEILELFRTYMYGHSPQRSPVRATLVQGPVVALDGLAIRRIVRVEVTDGPDPAYADLLIYTPNRPGKHPVFLNLSFWGNHSVSMEPDIPLSTKWYRPTENGLVINNRPTEKSRGLQVRRYPLDLILSRGYGLATCYYGDFEPDDPEGWKMGVRGKLQPPGKPFGPSDWAAISAWSWGLSCAMDYLETDEHVDPSKVAVIGHSRLGKAALWAGAQDERFALVISNCSGEGGAAISRRCFGETVAAINYLFPHWFCENFKKFSNNEAALPIDQHELIALIAPRPVYVASASEDLWADPKGEFLAAYHAEPVYRLFGKTGLGRVDFTFERGVQDLPPAERPMGDTIGYHMRIGRHDILRYDWEQYLNFADRHFARNQ